MNNIYFYIKPTTASEKVWGACALAIKAYALAKKGVMPESQGICGGIKTRLLGSSVSGLELCLDRLTQCIETSMRMSQREKTWRTH